MRDDDVSDSVYDKILAETTASLAISTNTSCSNHLYYDDYMWDDSVKYAHYSPSLIVKHTSKYKLMYTLYMLGVGSAIPAHNHMFFDNIEKKTYVWDSAGSFWVKTMFNEEQYNNCE